MRALPEGAGPVEFITDFGDTSAMMLTVASPKADALDLVLHLGDYIYESSWGTNPVRRHAGPEPVTLSDYRTRYAQYKTDPLLQAAHAAAPGYENTGIPADHGERIVEGARNLAPIMLTHFRLMKREII